MPRKQTAWVVWVLLLGLGVWMVAGLVLMPGEALASLAVGVAFTAFLVLLQFGCYAFGKSLNKAGINFEEPRSIKVSSGLITCPECRCTIDIGSAPKGRLTMAQWFYQTGGQSSRPYCFGGSLQLLASCGMPGYFELMTVGVVVLSLLVFAPIRFAFARAGFRHPLLPAIPTGIPICIGAHFAAQLTGVNVVFILAAVAVVVIYVAYSKFPAEGSQPRNANKVASGRWMRAEKVRGLFQRSTRASSSSPDATPPEPPPISTRWFYQTGRCPLGPIDAEELRQLAEAGIVTPETPVRKSPNGGWICAKKVRGLFQPTTHAPSLGADFAGTTTGPPASHAFHQPSDTRGRVGKRTPSRLRLREAGTRVQRAHEGRQQRGASTIIGRFVQGSRPSSWRVGYRGACVHGDIRIAYTTLWFDRCPDPWVRTFGIRGKTWSGLFGSPIVKL